MTVLLFIILRFTLPGIDKMPEMKGQYEVTFDSMETCEKAAGLMKQGYRPGAGLEVSFSCESAGEKTQ